jgi:hypothetical protein
MEIKLQKRENFSLESILGSFVSILWLFMIFFALADPKVKFCRICIVIFVAKSLKLMIENFDKKVISENIQKSH